MIFVCGRKDTSHTHIDVHVCDDLLNVSDHLLIRGWILQLFKYLDLPFNPVKADLQLNVNTV